MATTVQLKPQPVNKTVVFYSPIEGDDVLVRTGVIDDKSSFYHAFLHAYSKDYTTMDLKKRAKFAKRLEASNELSQSEWEKKNNGTLAAEGFLDHLSSITTSFYKHLNDSSRTAGSAKKAVSILTKNDPEKLSLYSTISDLLPLKECLSSIIPDTKKRCVSSNINRCKEVFQDRALSWLKDDETFRSLSEEKRAYIRTHVGIMFRVLAEECKNYVFYKFKTQNEVSKNDEIVKKVSNMFARDIYFLDSSRKMPFLTDKNNLKGRKSVILMDVGDNRYETVGKLLPANKVQREFDPSDPLIDKMSLLLKHPDEVGSIYPELEKYVLPQRNSSPSCSSSSMSSERSFSEYSEDDEDYSDDSDQE